VSPEIAARLAALGIGLMAEAKEYSVLVRDTCMALVHFNEAGCASLGSSGMMTENGLAYLVWRGERPLLVAKSNEFPAEAEQVEQIRKFSADLKSALGLE
jgi:hypothetical protein